MRGAKMARATGIGEGFKRICAVCNNEEAVIYFTLALLYIGSAHLYFTLGFTQGITYKGDHSTYNYTQMIHPFYVQLLSVLPSLLFIIVLLLQFNRRIFPITKMANNRLNNILQIVGLIGFVFYMIGEFIVANMGI
jgi:hypothetical protein